MSQLAAPPGVVVDCMVFVQAAANEKGPAAWIFDLLDEGKITLYVSKLILAEARYVLNRPDVRARLLKLTDVAIEALAIDPGARGRVPCHAGFLRGGVFARMTRSTLQSRT